jgi:hypothetical protein
MGNPMQSAVSSNESPQHMGSQDGKGSPQATDEHRGVVGIKLGLIGRVWPLEGLTASCKVQGVTNRYTSSAAIGVGRFGFGLATNGKAKSSLSECQDPPWIN